MVLSTTREWNTDQPLHVFQVGELVIDWNTTKAGVRLLAGLSDSRVESLVLRNAPSNMTAITMALWEEVEQLSQVLRRLCIRWYQLTNDIPYVFSGRRDALEKLFVSCCPETIVGSLLTVHSRSLQTLSFSLLEFYYECDYHFLWRKIENCFNLQELAIPPDMIFRPNGRFTDSIGVENSLKSLHDLRNKFPQLRQVSFHHSEIHADVKKLISKHAKTKEHNSLNLHVSCDNSSKSFFTGYSYDKIPTIIKCCEKSVHISDKF